VLALWHRTGKLRGPGRCDRDETARNSRSAIAAHQWGDGFEHRVIRLGAAETFHATPQRSHYVATPAEGFEELVDKRRLADARFAGDEHNPRFACASFVEQRFELVQLRRASDEGAVSRSLSIRRIAGGPGSQRRNETIAAAAKRFDKSGINWIVAERGAYRQHVSLQHLWLHDDFLPESVEKFVVRHEAAGVVDQILKHVVGTRP